MTTQHLKIFLCEVLPCLELLILHQHQHRLLELYRLCLPLDLQGGVEKRQELRHHLCPRVDITMRTMRNTILTNTHQGLLHLGHKLLLQDKHLLPQCHRYRRPLQLTGRKKKTTTTNSMPLQPANQRIVLENPMSVHLLNMIEHPRHCHPKELHPILRHPHHLQPVRRLFVHRWTKNALSTLRLVCQLIPVCHDNLPLAFGQTWQTLVSSLTKLIWEKLQNGGVNRICLRLRYKAGTTSCSRLKSCPRVTKEVRL